MIKSWYESWQANFCVLCLELQIMKLLSIYFVWSWLKFACFYSCTHLVLQQFDSFRELWWLHIDRKWRNKQHVWNSPWCITPTSIEYDSLYFIGKLIVIRSYIETDCAEITIKFKPVYRSAKTFSNLHVRKITERTKLYIIMMISGSFSNYKTIRLF